MERNIDADWATKVAIEREELVSQLVEQDRFLSDDPRSWLPLLTLVAVVCACLGPMSSDGVFLYVAAGAAAALALFMYGGINALSRSHSRRLEIARRAGIRWEIASKPAFVDEKFRDLAALFYRQSADETVKSNGPRHRFAWRPPNSRDQVGVISLRQPPVDGLSPARYRAALAARINRLVAAEDPEDAERMLDIVERRERLVASNLLGQVGEFLVENSEWLQERASIPGCEVSVSDLLHDPESLEWLESGEDTLELFLSDLYWIGADE